MPQLIHLDKTITISVINLPPMKNVLVSKEGNILFANQYKYHTNLQKTCKNKPTPAKHISIITFKQFLCPIVIETNPYGKHPFRSFERPSGWLR